jgi:hypothetical protein
MAGQPGARARWSGRRVGVPALIAAAVVALVPTAAWAHGGDENTSAYDSARQAIALIVSSPGNHEAIDDKIGDALESDDTDRVNLDLVKQAQAAMEREDEHATRRLLEAAIGARVHTGNADPVPIGEPAPLTGAATGTVAAVDAMPGRYGLTAAAWTTLAVSLLIAAAGVALAFQLRPRGAASNPDGELQTDPPSRGEP